MRRRGNALLRPPRLQAPRPQGDNRAVPDESSGALRAVKWKTALHSSLAHLTDKR